MNDLYEFFEMVIEAGGINVTEQEVKATVVWIEKEKVTDIMVLKEYSDSRFPPSVCYALIAAGWRYLKNNVR